MHKERVYRRIPERVKENQAGKAWQGKEKRISASDNYRDGGPTNHTFGTCTKLRLRKFLTHYLPHNGGK